MTDSDQPSDHDWDAYEAFVREFKDESDRAAVILGVAKLDSQMYQILKRLLGPTPNRDDELLDGDTPLATFSAKIAVLHRLGVIDPGFARSLHLIRKIRNAFAHEVFGCRLDSGAHRDRVRELFLPLKDLGFVQDVREHLFAAATGPAVDFRICLALMVGKLEGVLNSIGPCDCGSSRVFPPALWRKRIGDESG